MDGHPGGGWDVLVVSPSVPAFDRAAGSLRLYLMLQMLARRYRVVFLCRVDPGDSQSPRLHRRVSEAGRAHARQRWEPTLIEGRLLAAVESLRGLRPKPLSTRDRIGALAQDAYVRSGLARKVERTDSVAAWYVNRVFRAFRKH